MFRIFKTKKQDCVCILIQGHSCKRGPPVPPGFCEFPGGCGGNHTGKPRTQVCGGLRECNHPPAEPGDTSLRTAGTSKSRRSPRCRSLGYAIPASPKPWVTFRGHPSNACVEPMADRSVGATRFVEKI